MPLGGKVAGWITKFGMWSKRPQKARIGTADNPGFFLFPKEGKTGKEPSVSERRAALRLNRNPGDQKQK